MDDETCGTCAKFTPEPRRPSVGCCIGAYDPEIRGYRSTSRSRTPACNDFCPGWEEAGDEGKRGKRKAPRRGHR